MQKEKAKAESFDPELLNQGTTDMWGCVVFFVAWLSWEMWSV